MRVIYDGLDHDACYDAVASRDRRFDGVFFTAVRTTQIYCRPSCPAQTPRAENVEFYVTAAAAQRSGYRACKRCLPNESPGSPAWDRRGDTVGQVMQLIDDGVVDREGVAGVAARVGYSPRHLHRVLVEEVGAGTLDLARARRAHTARHLIDATDLSFADIAFASGFGSIRQFNDTIRSVYALTPTELRSRPRRGASSTGAISVHLAARPPFAVGQLFDFLAVRAIPGVEFSTNCFYARSLSLPHGHGVVRVRPVKQDGRTAEVERRRHGVDAEFVLEDLRDLAPAIRRTRALFDLDADPVAIDDVVGAGLLAPLVVDVPGLRAPGSVAVWETIVRAVIGQQVSVAGARTVTAKLIERYAAPLRIDDEHLSHVMVEPSELAEAHPEDPAFAMPKSRAATLCGVARAVTEGSVDLDADNDQLRRQLVALHGIGPWTADYVMMRGRHSPDVFLASDLGVRHAMDALARPATGAKTGSSTACAPFDEPVDISTEWAPWRSYAVHHLWRYLTQQQRCTQRVERNHE